MTLRSSWSVYDRGSQAEVILHLRKDLAMLEGIFDCHSLGCVWGGAVGILWVEALEAAEHLQCTGCPNDKEGASAKCQ